MATTVAACIGVLVVALPGAAPAPAAAEVPSDTGGGTLFVYPTGTDRPQNVEIWQNNEFYAYMAYRTDADGSNLHFEEDNLPAGSYQLHDDVGSGAAAQGWYRTPTSSSPTIATATDVKITDGSTTTVSWQVGKGATFSGTITDSAGKPIKGLCFSLLYPADGTDIGGAYSSATGAISMAHVLPGPYQLVYYDCDQDDTFVNAKWGYPVTYWTGTTGGAPTRAGAKPFTLVAGATTPASVRIAANGLLKGTSVYPSDSSFEQVEAYAGKSVRSGEFASAVGSVTGSTYSLVVPAGTYHVAFYCQGRTPSSTCSTGVYVWYGGGGFMTKAKALTVQPNKASTVNEGAIPTVVAENYAHLRQKTKELVSVYCIFSRSSCQGSESLALTVPALNKGSKAKSYKYSKGLSIKPHSTSLLSYALPATAQTALARHKALTATLTLSVRGQAAITQRFAIR